jgi:excisionase family DNA binding protein
MEFEKELNDIKAMLQEISGSNKDTLNFTEAARFIGCSKSYLYKLTSGKSIPHYKPNGKFIYFDRDELQAWLKQGKVTSEHELEVTAKEFIKNSMRGN